jgi:tricorn protease
LRTYHTAVFIYDVQNKKLQQATSGYYSSSSPFFDQEGKYLYLLTTQSFQPTYSSFDNTFIYPNSTQPAVISLKKSTLSLLNPKNDKVEIKKMDDPADTTKKKEMVTATPAAKPKIAPVEIDFDGFESRLVVLPVKAGNYGNISADKREGHLS